MVIPHVDDSRLNGAPDDRESHEGRKEFRKERDDIDGKHSDSSVFKFFSRFASSRRAPEDSDPLGAALRLLGRGHYDEAIAAFDRLLALDGRADYAFLFNKRGVANVRKERLEEARSDFERALSADARFAPALVNLGNLALEANRIEEALARYEAAIASNPEYPVAHFNASVAYKRLGRYDEAVRALRTAQKLERKR